MTVNLVPEISSLAEILRSWSKESSLNIICRVVAHVQLSCRVALREDRHTARSPILSCTDSALPAAFAEAEAGKLRTRNNGPVATRIRGHASGSHGKDRYLPVGT